MRGDKRFGDMTPEERQQYIIKLAARVEREIRLTREIERQAAVLARSLRE